MNTFLIPIAISIKSLCSTPNKEIKRYYKKPKTMQNVFAFKKYPYGKKNAQFRKYITALTR
jgi:hypothetical protein